MSIKRILIIILTLFHTLAINKSVSSSSFIQTNHTFSFVTSSYELFDNHIKTLYQECGLEGLLDIEIFRYGLVGYYNLKSQGLLKNDSILTIINYQQPSFEKRLYVINLNSSCLEYYSLVAHGMNTGNVYPEKFSNSYGSRQSSIGFFLTGEPYDGKHKYSLKLSGIDKAYNSNAMARGVVFHGAGYVSEEYISRTGRLGRSFGCPALPNGTNKEIIGLIKGGSCLFIYYPDENYLAYTQYLDYITAVDYCYGNRNFTAFKKIQPVEASIKTQTSFR